MKRTAILWAVLGIAALLVAFVPLPLPSAPPTNRFFQVDAKSFAYSPAVLRVNPGDNVTIALTSTDVVHGLYVDGYDVSVIADPGQTATLNFVADSSGTFRLRCSVTCGALHPFMLGKLQVGRNLLFWRGIGLALVALLGVLLIHNPILAEA
ncbi:MAG: cupredoxin domain-containing protein [Anaerolineales bacterium]|nr:cupredoxin domain-containing protein [Anaerolineales bacterium]